MDTLHTSKYHNFSNIPFDIYENRRRSVISLNLSQKKAACLTV